MQNLQYNFHLLLNSKYNALIIILINLLIYITISNKQIAYCMLNENQETNSQMQNEIYNLTKQIENLNYNINTLNDKVSNYEEKLNNMHQDIKRYKYYFKPFSEYTSWDYIRDGAIIGSVIIIGTFVLAQQLLEQNRELFSSFFN